MKLYRLVAAAAFLCSSAFGAVLTTTGVQADAQTQINAANPGDTVSWPSAGSATYGTSNSPLTCSKAITLLGNGFTINIATSAPAFSGTFVVTGGARVTGFTFQHPAGGGNLNTCSVSCGTVNGFRIDNCTHNGTTSTGQEYFAIVSGVYGLIDDSTINTQNGSDEAIYVVGPSNAWTTAQGAGTTSAVYVERCTETGPGYLTDANQAGRMVVRFNTLANTAGTGNKVDGHGFASDVQFTPYSGVRMMEVYNNTFVSTTGFVPNIEMRGGTGYVFDNSTANSQSGWFYLTDYGYQSTWPNFGNVYQTPNNYPIAYQIGTGQLVTLAATAITNYKMVTIVTLGTTNWGAIGDPAGTPAVGDQFIATGAGTGTGTATTTPAATEPFYVWGNKQNGSAWGRTFHAVAAGAITLYGSTFTEETLIAANRDFFADAGFDAAGTGLGVGTTAAMNASSPSIVGQGWWVTDQGSWNTTVTAGTSGLLYAWSGSAWVLKYTPYTYPYPGTGSGGGSTTADAILVPGIGIM